MRYLVVIEQGATSFGAYVPDLPWCVAAGGTRDEALRLIREAIELVLEDMASRGEDSPQSGPPIITEVTVAA